MHISVKLTVSHCCSTMMFAVLTVVIDCIHGRSLHPMTPISVQLEDTQVYLGPLNDLLATLEGRRPPLRAEREAPAMSLISFVCSDAFVCVGEAPGATGASALAAPVSASSAGADKEIIICSSPDAASSASAPPDSASSARRLAPQAPLR